MSLPARSGAEPCWAWATRVLGAGIQRGREAEAAGNLGREVGQDVAEHVGGDDHVEDAGVAHQQRRHGVDDALLVGDLREVFAATARVHSRKSPSETRSTFALCTAVTFLRRRIASAKAVSAMRVEPARVILRTASARSGVGMNSPGPTMHGAVGVKPLGVLARDHEIDRRCRSAAGSRRACGPGGCWR